MAGQWQGSGRAVAPGELGERILQTPLEEAVHSLCSPIQSNLSDSIFPCILCMLLCSQNWLAVTLGTGPELFLFFSCLHSAIWMLHSVPVCSQDLVWRPWPVHCFDLLFLYLTFHQPRFSLPTLGIHGQVQLFTPSFTLALSHPYFLRLPAQMSMVGPRDPLWLGPLSLKLCSAACGAFGHRPVSSWRPFPRKLGISRHNLPFMGIRDKLRNFKQCWDCGIGSEGGTVLFWQTYR